jgi:hypothetical protein
MKKERPSEPITRTRTGEAKDRRNEEHTSPDFRVLDECIAKCAQLEQLSEEEYDASYLSERPTFEKPFIDASHIFRAFLLELGFSEPEYVLLSVALGADYSTRIRKVYYPSVAYTLRAMEHMRALEANRSGAIRHLFQAQGIRNFARFSPEFWARQHDEQANHDPYMVVVIPSDMEDRHMTKTHVYTKLQDKLAELVPPHRLRVIEVDGLKEFYRAFLRLDKMYNRGNDAHPISLALFDGHGTSRRLFLGGGDNFGTEQLEEERFDSIFQKHFAGAFAKNAMFVLASCEAAGEDSYDKNSIGAVLKRKLVTLLGKKVVVVATTDETTPFSEFVPRRKKNGALRLKFESHSGGWQDSVPSYEKI